MVNVLGLSVYWDSEGGRLDLNFNFQIEPEARRSSDYLSGNGIDSRPVLSSQIFFSICSSEKKMPNVYAVNLTVSTFLLAPT